MQKAKKAVRGVPAPQLPVVSTLAGFPQEYKTTLRYKEAINLDPTAGQFKTYVYRANGLYDPNYTGTGHQPMGYDNLATLYSHYCVTKSRMKFTQITAPANPICFGVLVTDQNGSSGPWPAVTEQNPNIVSFAFPTQGSLSKLVVKKEWDLLKMTGVKDGIGSSYSSAVGADPTDTQYFVLFYQALDQSTDCAAQWYVVEIEYDVVFTVRKEMVSS